MLHPAHLLGASLLLSGCLSSGEARLPGGTYRLQPSSVAPKADTWEEVEFRHPKGQGKFLVHILNTGAKIRLTILDPATMATLLACSYENGELKRSGIDREIPDALPLALLQIATWPTDAVQAGLTGSLRIVAEPHRRVLEDQRTPVVIIEGMPPGRRTIRLPDYGAVITVQTAPQP
jgi:Protein of unknown function (DUF3261)